jgi:uracil-DNA glycosylase family 4
MDPARRREYLQAIGVDVWLPRHAPAPPIGSDRVATPETLAAEASAPEASRAAPARAEVSGLEVSRVEASRAEPTVSSLEPARERVPEVRPAFRSPASPQSEPLPAEIQSQWETLKAEVLGCTKCPLHATRTQGVFGVGNRRADWLIIGEAPGAEEDRQGEPFVGRGGQLLNAMLRAIGLPRESVFIANVLKSRPPGNRDPKPDEVAACLPYLMRQIALLQPKLMLAVGRIAAQNLLATDVSLGRLRGQVHTFGELNTPLIVTYHPAYLLRTPADKRKAWEDLKFARSVFRRLATQES